MHKVSGMQRVGAAVHRSAHNLAAVETQNKAWVEALDRHRGWLVNYVPAPNLERGHGDVRGRWPHRLGGFGATTVLSLCVGAQHASQARPAGDVHALVSQHGHDAHRRLVSKARFVGHAQHLCTFGSTQDRGYWTHGAGSAIASHEILAGLAAMQRAHVDAHHLAGKAQAYTVRMRRGDIASDKPAIFKSDHSAPPLLKITSIF